jgi:hypothetical protein
MALRTLPMSCTTLCDSSPGALFRCGHGGGWSRACSRLLSRRRVLRISPRTSIALAAGQCVGGDADRIDYDFPRSVRGDSAIQRTHPQGHGRMACAVQYSGRSQLGHTLTRIGEVHMRRNEFASASTLSASRAVRGFATESLWAVNQRLADAEQELRVQFTRIAQLQAQLDLLLGALRRSPDGAPVR